jgi:Kdo2-lipid IVA lauroyltransferase/acyltransferase
MKKIFFYIFYFIIYLVTLLPLRVLYLFSDFLFLLLYYFPSYRRNVVATNLKNSFPEKSDKERKIIARRYYRHMADLLVEALKIIHMSDRQIARRMTIVNADLFNRFYAEGRDVIAVCSHYNNWEWLSSVSYFSKLSALLVYKPLTNEFFDRLMFRLRSKYGAEPSPMSAILKTILKYRQKKIPSVSALVADQTPPKGGHVYWTNFLNQDTCFYYGTEKIAKTLDMAVVYVHVIKVKRGYYKAELTLITDHPKNELPGAITEKHVRLLENIIREKPEYWLWSHRRWKHKRPANE